MLLKIECSVEKSVTITAAKQLEDCINVVHVAYVVVVSQQSHSIFVFLHILSCKFSDNVHIHNIYIIQENVESLQIFSSGNIVHVDSLEFIGAQAIHFIDEQIEPFWSFFFQSLIAMQMESKCMKEAQVFVIWLSCIFFIRKTVDCVIFKQGFG